MRERRNRLRMRENRLNLHHLATRKRWNKTGGTGRRPGRHTLESIVRVINFSALLPGRVFLGHRSFTRQAPRLSCTPSPRKIGVGQGVFSRGRIAKHTPRESPCTPFTSLVGFIILEPAVRILWRLENFWVIRRDIPFL